MDATRSSALPSPRSLRLIVPPPAAAWIRSFLSLSFSYLNSLMSFSWALSLITALLTIFFALSAYLNVDKDSSKFIEAGETAHTMIVLELPPRAFYRIRVKLESRYGTTAFLSLPIALSAKTLIHVPKTVRLLLIAQPSLSLAPSAPVCPAFSEPAKSTRLITENFSVFLPSS